MGDFLLGVTGFVLRTFAGIMFEVLVQVLGFATGRVVLLVLSLGRVRVEGGPFTSAKGYKRTPHGILVSGNLAVLLGVTFWIVLFFMLVATNRLWAR